MGKAVVRGGFDTWAGAGAPSTEHPRTPFLQLDAGAREAFIYFKSPVPRGATVTKATLQFHARFESTGFRAITVRRIAESWKQGRLNWNNRPSTHGAAVTAEVYTLQNGDPIEFDVTTHLQTIANGARNYGWKVTTDSTVMHRLYGLNAGRFKPTLTVEWSDAPDKPTSLTPSSGVVATTHPVLQFDYTDVSGSTTLAAVQVQIDADRTGAADFDTGEVSTTEPELNLADTAFTGLTGTPTYWRVRVKDEAGLWSDYSDWTEISYLGAPTLTMTNPPVEGTVTEPTPPIAWSLSTAQVAWRVRIRDLSGKQLYDSGKNPGTATSHTLPAGILKDGRTYVADVRAWDIEDREAVPGFPTYARAVREFTMTDDPGTSGVVSFTATAAPDAPYADLTWERSTMPDGFAVYRDGTHLANLEPSDVIVPSTTTYEWRDASANPHVSNTYTVRAIVNGKQSAPGTSQSVTPKPTGIWLIDTDRDLVVSIAGEDAGTWTMPDDAATYVPVGSTETVRVVGGLRGYEGGLSGVLIDGFHGRTVAEQEYDLLRIKEDPSKTVRLVAGDVNINVVIGNVSIAPTPKTRHGDIVKDVGFDFWQVGELTFEPRL